MSYECFRQSDRSILVKMIQTSHIAVVVKMSWTHEAQPREMIILWNPLKICLLSISFQIDNKELLLKYTHR